MGIGGAIPLRCVFCVLILVVGPSGYVPYETEVFIYV